MQQVSEMNIEQTVNNLIAEISKAQTFGKQALQWTAFLDRMKLYNLDDEFILTCRLLVKSYLDKEKMTYNMQMQMINQGRIIGKLMLDQDVLEKKILFKDLEIPYVIEVEPDQKTNEISIKLIKDEGTIKEQ